MDTKRVKIIRMVISILIFSLIGRLFSLSILQHDEYSTKAYNQVSQEIKTYYPRGKILDRYGIPLSGRNEIIEENIILPEYKQRNLAAHVIGDLQYNYNNNTVEGVKGISGLQKIFDEELNGGLPIKILQYKDGRGQAISQGDYYVYGDHLNQGKNIKVTLDYHIQKVIEKEIESFVNEMPENNIGINPMGVAVVVMNVQNGEILGMASWGDENNKAVQSFPFGSVFKTLVSAVALEEGVVELDEEFLCNGTILIENQMKHCHKTEGHGKLTFKEGFAQSCNSVFFEVANRLTEYNPNGTIKGNKVIDFARKFGFTLYDKTQLDSFILSDKYSKNTLPDRITCQMDVFNMALGQGKIEASPLIATKIMATIANGGIMREPLLVKEILNQEGKSVEKFNNGNGERVISKQVNKKLQFLLREVAISGTAQGINDSKYGNIAGKTGTAENGTVNSHAWFSGYFPTDQPKYAMTVFVEQGKSGSRTAVPLFDGIADEILKLGQRN
ncbi:peptidoglycan D,D-transpeptidase FtsI family protein [Garciella nitratireducens]|uniref:Penicillin-binding protein 2 n=1 Tax=Garciella nitratireducens DSM 15102 TaxID=1121911 RepID=A0A1T4K7V9_9FIRM|nr:penicillin-binding transpeptidase domain-containing protein [Garciella nitratireducens]RBP46684.1 penicillin-binding protein 2 [Garciella nitratireducens]SJZ38499.1 penicillin-binding protein 2 [Garciella nitratireducens DSM 15102]